MAARRLSRTMKRMTYPEILAVWTLNVLGKVFIWRLYGFMRVNWSLWITEVNSRCFHWFPAAISAPLRRAQIWRFHTELYKFVKNFVTDNWNTEYLTDLRLGEVDNFLISYNIQDFFYSMVSILLFRGVTVKISNTTKFIV